ncbi:MAG: VCBS repeat-containing protein, partial [Planctomycetales bacterium]
QTDNRWKWRSVFMAAIVVAAVVIVVVSSFRPHSDRVVETPQQDSKFDLEEIKGSAARQPLVDRVAIRKGNNENLSYRDDPQSDGWNSEVLHEKTNLQLKALAALMSHPQSITPESVKPIVAMDFTCGRLRPSQVQEIYNDTELRVTRPAVDNARSEVASSEAGSVGAPRLTAMLDDLLKPLAGVAEVQVDFKQYKLDITDESIMTMAYYEASGTTPSGGVQQNGVCTFRWNTQEGRAPRLTEMRLDEFEQVELSPRATLFTDCTESVLAHNACFGEQLKFGMEAWMRRRQKALGVNQFGHNGLALGDVNGDGLEDLYVCQTGGLPNRLFLQEPDGTATDIAETAGVDFMDRTQSALLVDLDNDGDQDLVLADLASISFLANDGQGVFQKVSQTMAVDPYALASADFDQDGDLDIYACFYGELEQAPIPYHDANNGGSNRLLRNDGQMQFTDVTSQVGLDKDNQRWSFAASWEDYDNDGDVDLYVANDFGRNCLYRNDAGRFVNVADAAGVEDTASGMSVSWADMNRDGRMDVYVGNMFSSAGNRIAFQRQFHPAADDETREQFQRLARGNSLFVNDEGSVFKDQSLEAAVNMGRWAWGSMFADVNNDGWQDLVIANGSITNHNPKDL